MIWNELPYHIQSRVIDRIVDLLKDEEDDVMQDGIIAAVHELEVWSNSPCTVVDGEHSYEMEKDPFPKDDFEP